MQTIPDSHILHLTGSPRQRGQIHGEAMRGQIRDLLARWKIFLARFSKASPDIYIRELVTQTNFIQAIERWTPGLLDEVHGMAEGAGVDFNELFGFQLQDEEWWFGQDRKKAQQAAVRNCSSVGWKGSDGSPVVIAQNMDMPDYLDNNQVALRIADCYTGVESLVFSVTGLVALNGVNNHAIGVVCNNLGQLNHSKDGLPVAFTLRGVLEKRSLAEAKAFLQAVRHASGQNYLLGSQDGIIDLECSANRVAVYAQPGRLHSVCHTNHPFANDDLMEVITGEKQPGERITPLANIYDLDSHLRFESISRRSQVAEGQEAGPEIAREILRSHESHTNPVCRHSAPEQPWMTIGTSIMVLDEHPQLQLCPGPPCTSTFSVFDFQG